MTIDLDHVLSRHAAKDGTPPVIVEPGDPYPYLYVGLPDEDALVMAVGSVGFNPVPGEERPTDPPAISSIVPMTFETGVPTLMTVTGTGFTGGTVYQDESAMPTTVVSDTELTFTAEATFAGDIDVDVRNAFGTSNSISVAVTGTPPPEGGPGE